MVGFDMEVGTLGLAEASRRLGRSYVKDVRVFGLDCLPSGPILASRTTGLTDTLSSSSPPTAPDLKIIACSAPSWRSPTPPASSSM
jgi:hypothetical protein